MKDYLDAFQTRYQALEAHPKVEVVYYKMSLPTKDNIFKTIQKKLGHTLSKDLMDFYSLTNGLELGWRFKQLSTKTASPIRLHGKIALLPLEKVFSDYHFQNNQGKTIDDLRQEGESIALFKNEDNQWSLSLSDRLGSSKKVSFSEYLDFLIASMGLLNVRQGFFGSAFTTNLDLSDLQQEWELNQQAIFHYFPQSNKAGGSTKSLKTQFMQQKAEKKNPPSQAELTTIIEKHHQFLSTGGAGGQWKTFHVSGLVFGVYIEAKSNEGEQASFEQKRLASLSLDTIGLLLPFTNFCSVYAKYQDFSEADLSHSLFTDAMLEKTIFADANLEYCDFSRANLRGTSFMNANLKGADFENCDLTGADFRGANWKGAKFPGAILDKIVY